jgi:uncharacterized membrane protein
MDGRRRRELKETLELALGFVGFFTAAFFVITLVLELNRKDALWSAVTTLVLAALLAGVWVLRRRVLRAPERPDEP